MNIHPINELHPPELGKFFLVITKSFDFEFLENLHKFIVKFGQLHTHTLDTHTTHCYTRILIRQSIVVK